jgi:hypothetical protein
MLKLKPLGEVLLATTFFSTPLIISGEKPAQACGEVLPVVSVTNPAESNTARGLLRKVIKEQRLSSIANAEIGYELSRCGAQSETLSIVATGVENINKDPFRPSKTGEKAMVIIGRECGNLPKGFATYNPEKRDYDIKPPTRNVQSLLDLTLRSCRKVTLSPRNLDEKRYPELTVGKGSDD